MQKMKSINFLMPAISEFPRHRKYLLLGFSVLMGFVLLAAIPFTLGSSFAPAKLLAWCGGIAFTSALLLFLALALVGLSVKPASHVKPGRKRFLVYALPCIAVWVFYLLVFYPGLMTSDSITQWKQMMTFQLDDWHPVFHTLVNWLITRVWFSPAAVALFQILFLSAIFSLSMVLLEEMGVPKRLLFAAAIIFALSPVNGMLTISLWKDIPYSTSLLWLTTIYLKVFHTGGKWLNSKRNLGILCSVLISTAMLRHNGLIPAALSLLGLALFYKPMWKRTVAVAAITIVAVMIIKGPLYSALEVTHTRSIQSMVSPLLQVGAIVRSNGKITPGEKAFLSKLMPMESWRKGYNPYNVTGLVSKLNTSEFNANKNQFIKTWFSMASRNPMIALRAYALRTSVIWRISRPSGSYITTSAKSIIANPLGLRTSPILPGFYRTLSEAVRTSESRLFDWFFWRPAIYLYAIVFFGFILYLKHGYKALLLPLPVLANAAGLLAVTTSPSTRYFYSAMLVIPVLSLASLLSCTIDSKYYWKKEDKLNETDYTDTLLQ